MTWKPTKPFRWAWHQLIVTYLRRVGGDFHHGSYGVHGVYVILQTDGQYAARSMGQDDRDRGEP